MPSKPTKIQVPSDQTEASMAPLLTSRQFRLRDLVREHCTPEWRQLMTERNVERNFRKGEDIFKQGEVAEMIYMIRQGRVKITVGPSKQDARIVRLAGDGEVVGHRGIGEPPIYTATATALSDTTLDSIPMSLFLSVLKANASFCYHFLLFFAYELRMLDQHMRDLLSTTVPQRVARTLKMNMDAFGFDEEDRKKLAFTLSRRDIANTSDTTYESVIRTLAEFQRMGVIELDGKQIRILKKKELDAVMRGEM
jgi:CRP-like cAMP-binding protein